MRRALLFAMLATVFLVGCRSKPGQTGSVEAAGSGGSIPATSPPGATDQGSKPTVTIPDGPPPPSLQISDLRVGTGAEAVAGKTVVVNYVGVAWSTRKQFDSSWDRGQPLPFQLGSGGVIPGWDQGVAGMKVGGRRELIIPPELAYGPGGYPPDIGPNETLVFVIDLVAVQ